MPTVEERDRAKKGIKARQDAIRSLIAAHKDEFDRMVESNRLALGLSRRPNGATPEQLKKKIDRYEAQVEKWREELERSSE